MDKKDKFRGIPFSYLPVKQQTRLADRLDQDDGTGKDYFVFAQTLEEVCGFAFGVAEFNALKVLRSIPGKRPTLLLFNTYYINNPNITLDLVYQVFQQMELEDCMAILDESYSDTKRRYEARECEPIDINLTGQCEHRCRCPDCRRHDSTEFRTFPPVISSHHCHLQNPRQTSGASCSPPREPRRFTNLYCPDSNTSSEHQSLPTGLFAGQLFASPSNVHQSHQNSPQAAHQNEHCHYNPDTLNIRQYNAPSETGQNWKQRGPTEPTMQNSQHLQNQRRAPMSTSTVQLPYYQGSSLKTPVTQTSSPPGPETGAIPKHPREHFSSSDESPLSPLERQNRADSRTCLHRRNSSPHTFSSAKWPNEAPTLQNNPMEYHRQPYQNDLGKDDVNQLEPVSRCTCPTGVRVRYQAVAPSSYQNDGNSLSSSHTQHEWFPPSELGSEDDESEQTKLLEVVGRDPSQCTCPSQSSITYRQPSTKSDADQRRYSNPHESLSSSDNRSEISSVRRSSSDEELKRNDLSPGRSVTPHSYRPRQIKLFLTFADDSERHLEEVLSLGSELKKLGFSVKCDMFNKTIEKLINQPYSSDLQSSVQQFFSNTYDWLDYQVQNADYLVFCISPRYFQYVRPQEQIFGSGNIPANSVGSAHEAAGGAQPDNCHLHTKYIYNQACSEHFNALTQNKRFYPVLFQNSGATQNHIPNIFKSTLIFNYPDSNKSLLRFLENRLVR